MGGEKEVAGHERCKQGDAPPAFSCRAQQVQSDTTGAARQKGRPAELEAPPPPTWKAFFVVGASAG